MVDETKSSNESERDVDFSQLESSGEAVTRSEEGREVPSDIGEQAVRAELAKVTAERDDFQDKYLRALADAENIRKRAIKERSELIKYQGEQIVVDLLGVIDDFDLAMSSTANLAEAGGDLQKFRQGVEMIQKRFLEVLGKWDVRGESAVGKPFDPVRHEAISKISSADAEPGSVVNELKRAFFYKDKLIRPGQVIVAVAATEQS